MMPLPVNEEYKYVQCAMDNWIYDYSFTVDRGQVDCVWAALVKGS